MTGSTVNSFSFDPESDPDSEVVEEAVLNRLQQDVTEW